MHPSRMRTVRSSSRLSGGGVCSGGGGSGLKGGGVWSRGRLSGPGVGIPACTEADPPRGQTHACENITFATSLRTVMIERDDVHNRIIEQVSSSSLLCICLCDKGVQSLSLL